MSKLELRSAIASVTLIVAAPAGATQWDYDQCIPMTAAELIQVGAICWGNGRHEHFSEEGLRAGRWSVGADGVVILKANERRSERYRDIRMCPDHTIVRLRAGRYGPRIDRSYIGSACHQVGS
jgi:hypothetical protein